MTGSSATIKPGSTGQFDVVADGRLLFSKQAEGRFPEHDEILSQLR
jgi:selT/selW/selH-like putative selenoprotein